MGRDHPGHIKRPSEEGKGRLSWGHHADQPSTAMPRPLIKTHRITPPFFGCLRGRLYSSVTRFAKQYAIDS